MRYLEFNVLSEIQKMRALWEQGTLIAEREEGQYRYELFQLGDFYAEQKIHTIYNLRKALTTFKAGRMLEPYLLSIKVPSFVWGSTNLGLS